ncbi:hypothetical protein SGRIM128S_07936 [Streptomyces griseomycini]
MEVVEPRSRAEASAVMVATPMPTPMTAVSSGRPAASSEPKVMTRTTAATPMPMISAVPVCGTAWSASPPISTVSPASRASSAAPSSASREESSSSMPETL